jgi:hypothetical protein
MKRLASLALVCVLLLALCLPCLAAPQPLDAIHAHATWKDSYTTADGQACIARILEAGAPAVIITAYRYMPTLTSSTVTLSDKCPSDSDIRAGIRAVRAGGGKAILKLHLVCGGGWGGSIAPSSPTTWANSWQAFVETMATIAQQEGASGLVIGCELQSMTRATYTTRWRQVIAAARARFSGPLGYAANWGYPPNGEPWQVGFWDAVDWLCVDAYYPLSNAASPTAAEIVAAWRKDTSGADPLGSLLALAKAKGKPLIISEFGSRSQRPAGNTWAAASGVRDDAGQAAVIAGTLQALGSAGVPVWLWEDVPWGGDPLGMSLQYKAAYGEIAAAWKAPAEPPDPMPGLLAALRTARAAYDAARLQYEAAVAAVEAEAAK